VGAALRRNVLRGQRRASPVIDPVAAAGEQQPKVTDRAELREVIAATYRQVRWPSTAAGKYDGGHLPVWDEHTDTYLNP